MITNPTKLVTLGTNNVTKYEVIYTYVTISVGSNPKVTNSELLQTLEDLHPFSGHFDNLLVVCGIQIEAGYLTPKSTFCEFYYMVILL